MVPPSRAGSFSPNPAQTLQTGNSHSPNPSQGGQFSSGASPSTHSPTGTNPLAKIVVAQIYLLLSTIKEDKGRVKRETQADQLKKLLDDHGMEVFSKYFTRLVAGNAGQIFPGLTRPVSNPGNYHLLVNEMRNIAHDANQAIKIAESIDSGTEDIFRDFDLSTFMEHFKLDALEKTILALAFKLGSRSDLKTKADAILSTNFPTFVNIIARPDLEEHADLTDSFIATIVDRFIQYQPPNFNAASKSELAFKVKSRWDGDQAPPPSEVLAALDLVRVLADKPPNALATYIQRTGAGFTKDHDACVSYLQNRPTHVQLSEEQVSIALTYTTISQTPHHDPSILAAALRRVLPSTFRWQDVVTYFDQRSARISSQQFLRLYNALVPIAQDSSSSLNIEQLWGGNWENPETQLSFICAFASLMPDQLDASTIPGLSPTLTLDSFAQSPSEVRQRAAFAVKHPLVSVAALAAVFHVALHSVHASQTVEAKRLFQEVVVPNLDIFVVSAFGVPKPWPSMATETLISLFDNFLYKRSAEYDFVLDSLWQRDRQWVTQRLIDAHAVKPTDLPLIFEHAVKHKWLEDLVSLTSGFGLDLAAFAHAEGYLDLGHWARQNSERSAEVARSLQQFLLIKANLELQYQRPPDGQSIVKSTTLQVKTVSALLQILEDFMPKAPVHDLILVQRSCITVYPRLINYGEGYDDVIDANGADGNALPLAANAKMEEHYKKMYGDEIQVRNIVDVLRRYKHSRDPLDQDVFACMIHGLFDEYAHYVDYPLEALATTAVLFGGIISHKLIADLPLKIGLEAWKKAEDVVREHEEEGSRSRTGPNPPTHATAFSAEPVPNGGADEPRDADRQAPPFASINAESSFPALAFESPSDDTQGKIQFVLNNLTETTLQSMCKELRDMVEQRHQQWFASHLVEERAKMQPNYHQVYLDLVKLFEDKVLWAEVLRETYLSVARMLNSEATITNPTERSHLKNLGGWLGLLTLARDRPIKHKNIAFKQLLLEAHDTKRLVVVLPFVCKVLIQGIHSTVFRPPNPWLMDIIHLLIDLYHHAELKLNLKFEIEVLCKGLSLDHKTIEPSGEILNRTAADEPLELLGHDSLESFDNLSLNGLATGVSAEEFALFAAEQIIQLVFSQVEDNLALESLVHVLETLRKISGPGLNNRVTTLFRQQPGSSFLRLPLLAALLRTDLIDWRNVDVALAKTVQQRKEGSLEFLEQMIDLTLLGPRPLALYGDFVRTLDVAWTLVHDDPESPISQRLLAKLSSQGISLSVSADSDILHQRDQLEYVFDEWVHLYGNPNAPDDSAVLFARQMQARGLLRNKDDLFLLIRVAVDVSVDRYEHFAHTTGTVADAFIATDALAKMIGVLIKDHGAEDVGTTTSRPVYLDSVLALLTLVLSHHHLKRVEHFNQRVFHRLLSVLLHEVGAIESQVDELEQLDMLLRIASRLADLSPRYLPGFAYGWLSLIQHRAFLPAILKERAGWSAYTTLLRMLFEFVGQQLKAPEPTAVARDTYRATLKLLVVLQHDFTEYIAAHSDQLRMSLPPHCKQLINAILAANPASQDALSPNADQSNGSKAKETTEDDTAILLREHGLLGVVDQALHTGPSEDGLAHMTRAINESDARETGFAHVSIKANLSVIEAIILHVGKYAVGRLAQGGESFNPSSTDVAVLSLLMHELAPEPRYYLIVGMVNQLRFPGDMTSYFSRVLLEIFGRDLNDPDDTEIRQQITRVLWERLIGFWPQPWGLMITVLELLKNEKYAFFDLPFVKSSPEIIDRFHAVLQRA
ncbi:hypothetical protein VD0004_g7641 [Verticillium dahliae]|nr:hypothetical protein VD0004_g7641 [Verticillium dahliae]